MMQPGTIILLNGASCSGKTSIVKALQALMPEPYLHVGVDYFEAMQPVVEGKRVNLFYGQRRHPKDDPANWGPDFLPVMHQCVRAFSTARAGVVVEHVLFKRRWLKDAVEQLSDRPVLFVGVHCPLEVLEERERERRIRRAGSGQAARQHRMMAPLNAHEPYDMVVDTGTLGPEECALAIRRHLEEGGARDAFRRLRGSPILDEADVEID